MRASQTRLRDRLWLWGMKVNALQQTREYERLGFADSTLSTEQAIGRTGITNVLNGRAWLPHMSQGAELAFTLLITFFSVLLFSGGINEESGWRGFAQRRMQMQYSPLVASLILWVLMLIWHIPNDIVQYQYGGWYAVFLAKR